MDSKTIWPLERSLVITLIFDPDNSNCAKFLFSGPTQRNAVSKLAKETSTDRPFSLRPKRIYPIKRYSVDIAEDWIKWQWIKSVRFCFPVGSRSILSRFNVWTVYLLGPPWQGLDLGKRSRAYLRPLISEETLTIGDDRWCWCYCWWWR